MIVSAIALLIAVACALVALRIRWRNRPLLDDETFSALVTALKERNAGCAEIEQVYRTIFRRQRFTLDQTIKIVAQCKHGYDRCVYRRDVQRWLISKSNVENITDEILQEAKEQAVEKLLAAPVADKER